MIKIIIETTSTKTRDLRRKGRSRTKKHDVSEGLEWYETDSAISLHPPSPSLETMDLSSTTTTSTSEYKTTDLSTIGGGAEPRFCGVQITSIAQQPYQKLTLYELGRYNASCISNGYYYNGEAMVVGPIGVPYTET